MIMKGKITLARAGPGPADTTDGYMVITGKIPRARARPAPADRSDGYMVMKDKMLWARAGPGLLVAIYFERDLLLSRDWCGQRRDLL